MRLDRIKSLAVKSRKVKSSERAASPASVFTRLRQRVPSDLFEPKTKFVELLKSYIMMYNFIELRVDMWKIFVIKVVVRYQEHQSQILMILRPGESPNLTGPKT